MSEIPVDQPPAAPHLRLLVDTNVFIAVEPFDGSTESGLAGGARLLRLASEQGHALLVHPAIRDDLKQGREIRRRQQHLAELQKYSMLQESLITTSLAARAGASRPGSNDHRDLRLLAALDCRAATYLVSEDTRLRRRARRAGLGDAVLTINEAIALLEDLQIKNPIPPPHVTEIAAYTLDIEQEIFNSLRQEYGEADFGNWLDKVRADSEHRICLVIREDDGTYAALAIIKDERDCEYDLPMPLLKVSTFKVDEAHAGAKYGELLLKSIFRIAAQRRIATLYVEIFARHDPLIDLLELFGFRRACYQTRRDELVLVKNLLHPSNTAEYSPLEFHILFGPPAIQSVDRSFIIPIIPKWHRQLFPDSPTESQYVQMFIPGLEDAAKNHPSGNALRKAYLCNSNTEELQAGDALFFYRSHDIKAITTVGVVESTLRSKDPQEIMTFVGRRTVYRPFEIVTMCRSVRGVLAILFRQDRFIDPPWQLPELHANGVLRGWPQTIVRVSMEGCRWLRQQVGE